MADPVHETLRLPPLPAPPRPPNFHTSAMAYVKQLFAPRDLNAPPYYTNHADDLSARLQQTHLYSNPVTPPKAAYISRPQHTPSPPSTPISKANQCQGTTTTGKRCTRVVGGASKASPTKRGPPALKERDVVQLNRMLSRRGRRPISKDSDTSEDEAEEQLVTLPKFCHQHAAQAMEEPGLFAGPRGVWVVYNGALSF
jgi:hypothetical protein